MCPNCKKDSNCGCSSCRKSKGKPLLRTNKMVGDAVKCPYCRTWFHSDEWENYSYDVSLELKKEINLK